MFNPSARVKHLDGFLVGEFWDCHRLEPEPVQQLRRFYDAHLADHGKQGLVVDLGGVSFAGSTALASFVSMRRQGIRIVFFNAEPTVREVFRVSGLESLFLFGQNEADAIRILENSQSPSAVNRSEATPTATESTRRSPAQAPLKRNRGNP